MSLAQERETPFELRKNVELEHLGGAQSWAPPLLDGLHKENTLQGKYREPKERVSP